MNPLATIRRIWYDGQQFKLNNIRVSQPFSAQLGAILVDDAAIYQLTQQIKQWGHELGFADIGISDIDLSHYEPLFEDWLSHQYHGEMDYMAKHGRKRSRPDQLEPGTKSLISVRLNYFDGDAHSAISQLQSPDKAYISRYALHKDYHKLMRKRLAQLAQKIETAVEQISALSASPFHYRAFSDSAPVLERPIAEKAGLGFIGKNSLLIHPRAGSWFFLGELYTNLPLPADPPFTRQGCGPCTACIDECPTQAIVDNAVVDARRCISYLTIEYDGVIEESLRPLIGNRIYGCDDCQLVCPWNRFTESTEESAFKAKAPLDQIDLLTLLQWDETQFLTEMAGSPIRRIGYLKWLRNLCIAIGNDVYRAENISALSALQTDSELVNIHRLWALNIQKQKQKTTPKTTRPGRFSTPNRPAVAAKYYLPKPLKAIPIHQIRSKIEP